MQNLPFIPPFIIASILADVKEQLDHSAEGTKEQATLSIIALALCQLGMQMANRDKFIEHLIAERKPELVS